MSNSKRPKKKKSLVAKFFTIVFVILFIYVIALGAYAGYTYLNGDGDDDFKFSGNFFPTNLNILPKVPERTNVLLLGVDADLTRTDTIMIASFNSVTKDVNLFSIPRDTLVEIPKDRWNVMCDNVSQLKRNGSREIKINSIHSYAGEDKGIEFLELQLEEMLDIDIDYYARVNCEAFRYIVDSIGGVEYDVPMRMKHKDTTKGKELYIDLQPGLQLLDGDKAEQLVRFRYGYARQDLDRIETQQDFMKVLAATILDKDNIMSNPTAYLNTIVKYVDTDLGVTDAVKYIKYVSDISASNIVGYTLPGESQYIGDTSYYIMDEEEAEELVYDLFKRPASEKINDDSQVEESFDKDIQILNGGYISGLANNKKKMLEEKGYTVSSISDYQGTKAENTRIYVKKTGMGEDLAKYFVDAKVVADHSKLDNHDIVIVLGTDETESIPESSDDEN